MLPRLPRIFFVVVLLNGCAHFKWNGGEHPAPESWTTYGGGAGRTNIATGMLVPPLRPAWELETDAGFSPSATLSSDTTLVVGTLDGEVHLINTSSGEELWSNDFGSSIIGSPLIDSVRLYVALAHDEEGLLCYNLRRTATEWKLRSGDVETSPLLLGEHLIVATLREGIICVDKLTGAILWKFELPVRVHAPMIHSSPASDGATIVFGCDDGALYAISALDGTFRWKNATGGAILASPSIDDSHVYVGSLDGSFYAFRLADGGLVWKRSLGSAIYASQAVDTRRVYIGTVGRKFFALEKMSGTVDWEFPTDGALNSAPIVSADIVYFGSIDKNLYALRCSSGELLWKFGTRGRIKSMPIVRRDQLIVPVEDSSILTFVPGSPR